MNKTYIILASVLILLGIGLIFLESNPNIKEVSPKSYSANSTKIHVTSQPTTWQGASSKATRRFNSLM